MQNVILELRHYSEQVDTHSHDYHQLVLPLFGSLEIEIDHNADRVYQQKAAFIAAGHQHVFSSSDNNAFIVADIPLSLAPTLDELPSFITLTPGLQSYAQFLSLELAKAGLSPQTRQHMLLLLLELITEYHCQLPKIDKRVETARAYLDSQLSQSISLDQLAKVAHLSRRHLSELFRQNYNMSPQEYLREKRMQIALKLLQTNQLTIQQIALEVGYQSQAAFSDRFRRHFGLSPKHFRKNTK